MKHKSTFGHGMLQLRGCKSCSEIPSRMKAVIKAQVDISFIREYLYLIPDFNSSTVQIVEFNHINHLACTYCTILYIIVGCDDKGPSLESYTINFNSI